MDNVNVTKLKSPFCQKVLPLVYDDSLSYYESICKFVDKVNEVIDTIEGIADNVLAEANAYTDRKILENTETLRKQYDDFVAEVNAKIFELDTKYAELDIRIQNQFDLLKAQINNRMIVVERKVSDLENLVNTIFEESKAYTDLKVQYNNEYLLSQMETILADVKVVNYFTGEKLGLQDMINYLCGLHVEDAISYTELASRNLTYDHIASLNISYTSIATRGGSILV